MKILKGLLLCSGVLFTSQAFALSQPCRTAASLGGPCGCVASEHIFGHSDRSLWAVSEWLHRFPRTTAAAGVAAVWPGRHVEAVISANGDGTVTTNGPYGVRRVRAASVVFVDPHGQGGGQVASGTVGRTHVAARVTRHVITHYAHVYRRGRQQHYASAGRREQYASADTSYGHGH